MFHEKLLVLLRFTVQNMSGQLYTLMVGQGVGGNFLGFKARVFYRSMKVSALFIKVFMLSTI